MDRDERKAWMSWTGDALEKCLIKIEKNIDGIGDKFPHVAYEGQYNGERAAFWTAGFWPGLLWLLYMEKKEDRSLKLARRLEERLDEVLGGFVTLHHDVGFMWLPSAVIDYKLTGNPESRVRGLKAASHLAGRFNLAGRFIRAWNDDTALGCQGWAIIDCLMNIPLLFWASKETGDPRFYHIADAHAGTVLKSFIRPDHTSAHIVRFDPCTGKKIENLGGQGKGPDSAWSRGQAWTLYGMAIAFRETGKDEYLAAAEHTAEYFLAHLPEDKVPYWDFRCDPEERYAFDSSASACAASGLLEIAGLVKGPERKKYYRQKAEEILKSLYENFADFSSETQGILQKGTVNFPKNKHINVPIIYGDYFFTEALIKRTHETNIF